MAKLVQRAVDAIIRPPRTEYDQASIPQFLQGDDEVTYVRHPIGFINTRNQPLIGSYYHGVDMDPTYGGPCVLYLHGNASSQLEGQFLVPNLCKYKIYVCCFDFAGCGCSGGDYVSLGYFEKEDTEFLLDQLHKHFNLGPFILWGRSMGAATALLVDYPLVVARISDSSFTSVPDMCAAIAVSMHLPSFFVPAVIWFLKKQVIQAANFNIEEVSPISICRMNEIPCVFGHAEDDQFIPFEQCRRLYDHYPCKMKFLMQLEGGHNGKRKKDWIQLGVSFILENFCIDVKNPIISSCRKLQQSVYHFSSFSAMVTEKDHLHRVDSKLEEDYMNEFLEEEGIKDQINTGNSTEQNTQETKTEDTTEKKKKKKKNRENDNDGGLDENGEKKKKKKKKNRDGDTETELDENGEKKKKKKKHKHHKNKDKKTDKTENTESVNNNDDNLISVESIDADAKNKSNQVDLGNANDLISFDDDTTNNNTTKPTTSDNNTLNNISSNNENKNDDDEPNEYDDVEEILI